MDVGEINFVSGSVTVSGSAIELDPQYSSNAPLMQIDVYNGDGQDTITSTLADDPTAKDPTTGLWKTGPSDLQLEGTNTYHGVTEIVAGTMNFDPSV